MCIRIENVEVLGWKHVIRGMRNPKNSWHLSDSGVCEFMNCSDCMKNPGCDGHYSEEFELGKKDHKLMMSLANGGPVHAKYRRMITVYLDITAPLYWWKEFDTYKVGTVANSCSTMHKIHDKEFTLDDFSCEHLINDKTICWNNCIIAGPESVNPPLGILNITIDALNTYRERYLVAVKTEEDTGLSAKDIWWQMIQLLPSSYNQKRTIMLNYEVLHNMYVSRLNHKLDEWREFCNWIESLPYSEIITGEKKEKVKQEPTVKICETCKGTGVIEAFNMNSGFIQCVCPKCNGKGVVKLSNIEEVNNLSGKITANVTEIEHVNLDEFETMVDKFNNAKGGYILTADEIRKAIALNEANSCD